MVAIVVRRMGVSPFGNDRIERPACGEVPARDLQLEIGNRQSWTVSAPARQFPLLVCGRLSFSRTSSLSREATKPDGRRYLPTKEDLMAEIREHMKVIGKDGTHVGTVDRVEGDRIKLTKKDNPAGHQGHHHFIDRKLVGSVEGDTVKLSVDAASLKTEEA